MPLGRQEVCVTGEFEGVRKNMILSFTRLENLWITPSVFPNPARPGQALDLYCESSSNVDSVTVHLFETSVALTKTGTDWEGIASIPAEALEGLYPVVFTGRSKNREVNATIYLQVDTLKITDLVFTLTR